MAAAPTESIASLFERGYESLRDPALAADFNLREISTCSFFVNEESAAA
jgi:hypothetical protein